MRIIVSHYNEIMADYIKELCSKIKSESPILFYQCNYVDEIAKICYETNDICVIVLIIDTVWTPKKLIDGLHIIKKWDIYKRIYTVLITSIAIELHKRIKETLLAILSPNDSKAVYEKVFANLDPELLIVSRSVYKSIYPVGEEARRMADANIENKNKKFLKFLREAKREVAILE